MSAVRSAAGSTVRAPRPAFEQRPAGPPRFDTARTNTQARAATDRSWFEKHRWYIVGGVAFLILIAILIPILHNKHKKKQNKDAGNSTNDVTASVQRGQDVRVGGAANTGATAVRPAAHNNPAKLTTRHTLPKLTKTSAATVATDGAYQMYRDMLHQTDLRLTKTVLDCSDMDEQYKELADARRKKSAKSRVQAPVNTTPQALLK